MSRKQVSERQWLWHAMRKLIQKFILTIAYLVGYWTCIHDYSIRMLLLLYIRDEIVYT